MPWLVGGRAPVASARRKQCRACLYNVCWSCLYNDVERISEPCGHRCGKPLAWRADGAYRVSTYGTYRAPMKVVSLRCCRGGAGGGGLVFFARGDPGRDQESGRDVAWAWQRWTWALGQRAGNGCRLREREGQRRLPLLQEAIVGHRVQARVWLGQEALHSWLRLHGVTNCEWATCRLEQRMWCSSTGASLV